MYKVKLNDKDLIDIIPSGNKAFIIEGSEYKIESFQPEKGFISIQNGETRYRIVIQNVDYQNKTFQLRLNNIKHTVQVKDKFDLILDELGFDSKSSSMLNQIKAPMPGLILEVNVNKEDHVNKGDKLLVLEAMKMENVIKSPGQGIVKEVRVSKGDSVEKNQVLIQF